MGRDCSELQPGESPPFPFVIGSVRCGLSSMRRWGWAAGRSAAGGAGRSDSCGATSAASRRRRVGFPQRAFHCAMPMDETPPFPFVVGSIRSGTTLLRLMLDAHPLLAIPPESYFPDRLLRRRARYETRSGLDLGRLVEDLLTHPELHHLRDNWKLPADLVRNRLAADRPASLPDAIRALYSLYARVRAKPRYGDKTPVFVLKIDELASVFPESRFVHVIRDGRDVTLSVLSLDHPDHPHGVPAIAKAWAKWVRAGRRAGGRLGAERYREVRYEQLVEDPVAVLRGLCGFLELDYDPAMLRYYEHGLDSIPAHERWQHPHVAEPPSVGLRDWRKSMAADDLAAFEAIAGKSLADAGYARTFRRLPLRSRAKAVGMRVGAFARPKAARLANRRPGRGR